VPNGNEELEVKEQEFESSDEQDNIEVEELMYELMKTS
jgi:hypothetical protein